MTEEFDKSADAALVRIQKALNSYGGESPYCESTIDPDYDIARVRRQLNTNSELLEALETARSALEVYAGTDIHSLNALNTVDRAVAKARGENDVRS